MVVVYRNVMIANSNLDVLRQVQIDESYKADFVCFNNETDKLCVVEVDGQQHFNDQDQIDFFEILL